MSDLKKIASQVRRDIVRMVHGVQSGHPGGSLGCAEPNDEQLQKALTQLPETMGDY